MPGANLDLELVPLEADGDGFTIFGRFPPGFVRDTPGGYLATEEFVVLEGSLAIDGTRYAPGDLTVIPASRVRTVMRAPEGCTVLAWFSGQAIFRTPDELDVPSECGVRSVSLRDASVGELLVTSESRWVLTGGATDWQPGAEGFDVQGTGWARAQEEWPGESPIGRLVLRIPRVPTGA